MLKKTTRDDFSNPNDKHFRTEVQMFIVGQDKHNHSKDDKTPRKPFERIKWPFLELHNPECHGLQLKL